MTTHARNLGQLGIFFSCALTGCMTVGPNYHLPPQAKLNGAAAQGAFIGAHEQPALSEGPLPDGWWHLYDQPELNDLVAEALSANTDLRIAEANLERSQARTAAAHSARWPTIGLGGDGGRGQLSAEQYLVSETLPVLNLYDIGFTAAYQIDLFGGIRRGIEAAEADDEAVAAARDAARISVVASVVRAYLAVCAAGDQIATAKRSLNLQLESLQLTQELVRTGRGTRLELTRSNALIEQFQATLPAFEAQRREAIFRLAALTGKAPGEFHPPRFPQDGIPALKQVIPVGNGASLLRRRPDVRAAERRLASATAEIGVAVSGLYPKIELGASVGSTGALEDFLTRPTNRYMIGPGIRWELNQGPGRARIAAAKAAQKAELARFDGVVITALRDVETALNAYVADLERGRRLQAARDQAATAVDDARQLQKSGRLGSLALLDAERTLATSEATLAGSRAQVAQDQVSVFLALGGGWEKTDSETRPAQATKEAGPR